MGGSCRTSFRRHSPRPGLRGGGSFSPCFQGEGEQHLLAQLRRGGLYPGGFTVTMDGALGAGAAQPRQSGPTPWGRGDRASSSQVLTPLSPLLSSPGGYGLPYTNGKLPRGESLCPHSRGSPGCHHGRAATDPRAV